MSSNLPIDGTPIETYSDNGGSINVHIKNSAITLVPGKYSLTLKVSAITAASNNKPISQNYTIPIVVGESRPVFPTDLQMDSKSGSTANSDDFRKTNQGVVDGKDHTYYFYATGGVYADSKVLFDGSNAVPVKTYGLQPGAEARDGALVSFTVPAAVAARLAGASHQIQVANTHVVDASGNPAPPLLSAPISLFWVSPATTITNGTANGQYLETYKLTPTTTDPNSHAFQTLDIDGDGFVSATTATLGGVACPVTIVNYNHLKVQVPDSILQQANSLGQTTLPLVIGTPPVKYDADAMRPAGTGGGYAKWDLQIEAPAPLIQGSDVTILVPGKTTTLNLTVSNIILHRVGRIVVPPLTQALYNGKAVRVLPSLSRNQIRVVLPGDSIQAGTSELILQNGTRKSAPFVIPVVHPTASLLSFNTVGRLSFHIYSFVGKGICSDTKLQILSGEHVVFETGCRQTEAAQNISLALVRALRKGETYTVRLFNPFSSNNGDTIKFVLQ